MLTYPAITIDWDTYWTVLVLVLVVVHLLRFAQRPRPRLVHIPEIDDVHPADPAGQGDKGEQGGGAEEKDAEKKGKKEGGQNKKRRRRRAQGKKIRGGMQGDSAVGPISGAPTAHL